MKRSRAHHDQKKKASKIMTVDTKNKGLWGGELIVFDSLESTNKWVLDPANDCQHGDIIYARTQTCGRGRFHRNWHTPKNTCLTISIVICPGSESLHPNPLITQHTAIAIRNLLDTYKIKAMLKWPNDVFVNSQKIAGILAEHSTTSNRIALGIGLNVNIKKEDFKDIHLRQPATSMNIETGIHYDIDTICLALSSEIKTEFADMKHPKDNSLQEKWQSHDYLTGKNIRIETAKDYVDGRYSGMDKEGRITLTDDNRKLHSFWSGDVSTRELS